MAGVPTLDRKCSSHLDPAAPLGFSNFGGSLLSDLSCVEGGLLRSTSILGGGQEDCIFKALLLGDSGAGKSYLLGLFTRGTPAPTQPTVGVGFASQVVAVDGRRVRLQLWDMAGAVENQCRAEQRVTLYRHAVCALLVYNVTDRSSFLSLPGWAADLCSTLRVSEDSLVTVLAASKTNLPQSLHAVTHAEGQELARQKGWLFYELGTDQGQIESMFVGAARAVIDRLGLPSPRTAGSTRSPNAGGDSEARIPSIASPGAPDKSDGRFEVSNETLSNRPEPAEKLPPPPKPRRGPKCCAVM
eukprot:TRINITY_DN33339_c0_g1_i1.p1 TRINITY_DN33339_c0_g1~~TRINITY_DN33339_c0_g1_i1.p1  ORF type:complete len:327 (+),score=85.50 TRINITY_DN33339_c0_g1_i1:82-981(+)